MLDYLDILDKTFSRLIDNIGYIYTDREGRLKIVQKDKPPLRLRSMYFDFKRGEFIHYKTILANKNIISKLREYADSNLVCFAKISNGFEVKVYNKYGELIYKNYIKLFDETNRLTRWYLSKRYPDLVLDNF